MIPLSGQQYEEDSGPELGFGDAAEAAWDLNVMDTFMGNYARNTALDEMEKSGAKVLSPEELNQKYPDVSMPFKEPTNELVAFHLNEEGKKRKFLNSTIEKGGGDYGGTISTAAGLVAHMADPVEFGAGALFSMGVGALGAVAARGTFGARAAVAGRFASGTSFAKEAVEGVAGNLLLEPYMYESAHRAQEDYSVYDAALNVVAGGLAFPTAIFGVKKAWGGLKHVSDSVYGTAIKNSIGTFIDGYRPQIDKFKSAYDNFIFGVRKDGPVGEVRSSYSFQHLGPEELKTRPMYAASKYAGSLEGGVKPIGDNYFGDGVYLTDNPSFANNLAAHPMESDLPFGDVFQMKIDQANLLDMDSKIHDLNISDDLKGILEGADTIQEAMDVINSKIDADELDDSAMLAFQDEIRQSGYDGFKFTEAERGHNGAYIFPESAEKLSQDGFYKSDTATIQAPDRTELRKTQEFLRDDSNRLEFDNTAKKEWDQFSLPEEHKVTDINKIQSDMDDFISTLDSMKDEKLLSKESLDEIEKIKAEKSLRAELEKAANDLANCYTSGVA